MSIIEKLTEGIVNRDMKKEGAALLNKWSATGLLEGLETEQMKHTMSRLLENQAKELLREASSLGAGDVQGFAAVAFPIVRRVFAGLIANDLVSVQPMSLPSGLIFFLDFVYGDELGGTAQPSDTDRFGNLMNASSGGSIYGTNQVGSQITGGVDLVGAADKENLSGPRQMVGYAYGSAEESGDVASGDIGIKEIFAITSTMSDSQRKLLKYDPDLLSLEGDATHEIAIVDVEEDALATALGGDPDYDNLAAFTISDAELQQMSTDIIGSVKIVRRLTSRVSASEAATTTKAVRFVVVGLNASLTVGGTNVTNAMIVKCPLKDQIDAITGAPGAVVGDIFNLEANANIPEIDIKVDSVAITAQTKKLKAKWSPELGQDLNAYHNLDAEVELTSILSEQIALELDREILADLVNGATAAVYYWSRAPGLFVNRVTGAELGQNSAAPDFTGTVSEWYETLIETINDVSAQIHLKTLRGGANFVVTSPEVANILEFTSGFRANVTADADKGDIGAVKAGALNRKFDVIVDPYFPRNVLLVGRKGNSFLESGYVYAPYVPLQTTPTIFGVEDFVPRKGVMTRYAKKMVRPDMYGLVIVRGLLGEAGATS